MQDKTSYDTTSRGDSTSLGSRGTQSGRSRSPSGRSRQSNYAEGLRLLHPTGSQPRWIFDIETLAFLEVNEAASQAYGYTEEEFLEMKITDILTPEDVPLLPEYLDQLRSDR